MSLFSKEKEIIFRITNAILLIWFVAAVVVMCVNIISLFVKDPTENYTYEEYSTMYCSYYLDSESDQKITNCETQYNSYQLDNDSSNYYKKLTIYGAAANIVVVAGVMYFLNKEKKTQKK